MARARHDGRLARLQVDYDDLLKLASRSEGLIEIEPVDVQPGWPPEKYILTFRCRGISAIDDNKSPVASEFHQCSLYLPREYPGKGPTLLWLTSIWHPNIDREEPRHVCTNEVQTWHAQKPLRDLVLTLAEMVQYKVYYAKWEPPFPQDKIVAEWVREVAEPNGWVGPDKPWDDRPVEREYRIRQVEERKGAKPQARRTPPPQTPLPRAMTPAPAAVTPPPARTSSATDVTRVMTPIPARTTTPAQTPPPQSSGTATSRISFGSKRPSATATPPPSPPGTARISFGARRPPREEP